MPQEEVDKLAKTPRPIARLESSGASVPKVCRAMKKDEDGLPVVGADARCLGVRHGIDISVDDEGTVITNGEGMSVSPLWRKLPLHRIPKRLGDKVAGARGPDTNHCFSAGSGIFCSGAFAAGLTLRVDRAHHGTLAPVNAVPLESYEASLAATRHLWTLDEA